MVYNILFSFIIIKIFLTIIMKTNLCLLYHEELWYQVGELIQELVILIKNCFLIKTINNKNIWNIFGDEILMFFHKFTNSDKEILPRISLIILTIGILRFQPSFDEDKIIILEKEIYNSTYFRGDNFAIILFFRELVFFYSKITFKDFPGDQLFPIILKKKIVFSEKIRKAINSLWGENFHQITQLFQSIEKISKKNQIISSKIEIIKKNFSSMYTINQPNLKIVQREKFARFSSTKSTYIYYAQKGKYQEKNLKLPLIFHYLPFNLFTWEKEEWFFNNILINTKTKKLDFFFNQVLNRKFCIDTDYYSQFFINLNKYSSKINLRWSYLCKKLNGDKIFIEKLFKFIFPKIPNTAILTQERELISLVKDCFFASLVDNNGTGNSSYNIQKILNKISILKTKILKKI